MKQNLTNSWKVFLTENKNRVIAPTLLLFISILLIIYPNFLNFIEIRKGVLLNDPILALIKPIDLTWFIFGTLYSSIILAVIYLLNKPELLFKGILAYSILIIIRLIAMYMVPLEAPSTMLALNDPFVQLFGTGKILTKDLFFSGHTSMMFLLFLIIRKGLLKWLFLLGTAIVGISVIIQHVHYSIDVFSAPFFSYCSYRISLMILNNFNKHPEK